MQHMALISTVLRLPDRKQTGGGRIVSGHLPENPGTVGQDTKRRKSEKLFTICCNSDLENRNRKINRRNSIAPMESEEPMEPAAGGNGEQSEVEDHLLKRKKSGMYRQRCGNCRRSIGFPCACTTGKN